MNRPDTDENPTATKRPAALSLLLRAAVPIFLLVGGGMAYTALSKGTAERELPPDEAQILRSRVTRLTVQDYPVVITTQGVVQPHNETTLSAEVPGQIVRIAPVFEVGAFFAAGDVLVELDPRDYETALAIARSERDSAEAALKLATQNNDRLMSLFEEDGIGTQAELDQAIATQSQAAAELETSLAQLERAERDLTRTSIRAPIAGRVRTKTVGVGQMVNSGTPLGVVFAVDYAEVRFPIQPNELAYLDLPEMEDDPPVAATLRNAIVDGAVTEWPARIVRTEGALDEDSLELVAIARIDDPFGLETGLPPLRIGQPVQAEIAGETLTDVLALPRVAVRELDRVLLLNEANSTLMSRTISPIWSDEDHIIIEEGPIPDGSLLCTTHLVYAPDGAPVEIIPDVEEEPRRTGGMSGEIDS